VRGRLVVLVGAGMMLAGAPALAADGSVRGYCDADGNPKITEGYPGWEQDFEAYCNHGRLTLKAKHEFPVPTDNVVIKRPEDFARWVNIDINKKTVINPYGDVVPYIAKSSQRTLVPLRYLSEAFGAQVAWNQEKWEATVVWRGKTIVVPIGKDKATVNGQEVRLDQPALLWNSRTMVPLRFLLEAVGATVTFDDVNDFVHITLEGVECPPNYCP
jgi:hypothetical protein